MNDGKRKKAQKYQNKTGYKIKYDTKAIDHQKKVSLKWLCSRCCSQIEWKLKYNKYKKITEPGHCNFCHLKNVVRSYMKACDDCAEQKKACVKCLALDFDPVDNPVTKREQEQQQRQEERNMNKYIDSLRERSRRTINRKYEKGTITWNNEQMCFMDEDGEELTGLHFKKLAGEEDYDFENDLSFDNKEQSEEDCEEKEQQMIQQE